MATMGGFMNSRPSNDPDPEDDLFTGSLVVSDPHFEKKRLGTGVSVAVHVVLLFAVVLLPILWPEAMPDQNDYIRALLYNPPPPPPPPLPKGSSLVQKQEPAKPTDRKSVG